MGYDINRVILIGRLTADPELKYTSSGKGVIKISIAVGEKPNAYGTDGVSFFNVTAWDKTAENVAKYLTKGNQFAVDGRLHQNTWTAQDGTKRSAVEIIADRIEFLTPKSGQTDKPAPTDGFYDDTGFDPTPVEPPTENEPNF